MTSAGEGEEKVQVDDYTAINQNLDEGFRRWLGCRPARFLVTIIGAIVTQPQSVQPVHDQRAVSRNERMVRVVGDAFDEDGTTFESARVCPIVDHPPRRNS